MKEISQHQQCTLNPKLQANISSSFGPRPPPHHIDGFSWLLSSPSETRGLLTAKLGKHVVQVSDFHLGGHLNTVVQKKGQQLGILQSIVYMSMDWFLSTPELFLGWGRVKPCNTLQGQPTKKFMENFNYTPWHEHVRLYTTCLSLAIPKLF